MRLLLFGTLFIGWLSYYLCQRILPSSMAHILSLNQTSNLQEEEEQTAFSKAYLGQLQSFFAVSYSISFLISGIMSDVVNVKVLFSMGLLTSGILLAIFPLAEKDHLLGTLVYVCLGLTLGCGWPSTARILRQTYRPSELGVAWGIMSTSSSFATYISPLLVSAIIGVSSWKYGFYTFGLIAVSLTVPISVITSFVAIPDNVVGGKSKKGVSDSKTSWFHVAFVGQLWGVMIVHAMMWVVKASTMDWGQVYLMQRQGLDEVNAGKAIGFVQLGGVVGKITMGYVSNLAMKSQGVGKFVTSGRTCRTLVLVVDLLLLCVVLVRFGTLSPGLMSNVSYSTLLVIFCIGLFCEGAIIIVSLSSMDVVPRHLSGTGQAVSAASALMIGRFLAGWPFTGLIEWIGWSPAFLAVSSSCVVAIAVSCSLVVSFHQQHLKLKKAK